jgi:F-type H+-transporting ATPase subunit delta
MSMASLARRYARALLELASEQKQVERVGKDLAELSSMWSESAELRELFGNPQFGLAARKSVLSELLSRAGVSPIVRNTALYLTDRNRVAALPEIARAFAELAEEADDAVRAEVTSAAALSEGYYAQLQKALEQATGKKVTIERKTDPALIAGVVTRVGDRVFDGSVRTRLEELKESLIHS